MSKAHREMTTREWERQYLCEYKKPDCDVCGKERICSRIRTSSVSLEICFDCLKVEYDLAYERLYFKPTRDEKRMIPFIKGISV